MAVETQDWLRAPPLCWFREHSTRPDSALVRRGDECGRSGAWDEAFACFEAAKEQAEDKGDRRTKANALIRMAEICRIRKDVNEALRHCQEAMSIFKLLDDGHNRAVACRMAGILAHRPAHVRQAFEWYDEALKGFARLRRYHVRLGNQVKAACYEAWCHDVHMRIEEVKELYQPKTNLATSKPAIQAAGPRLRSQSAIIQLIPIEGRIAAGEPIGMFPKAKEGYMTCEELLIHDQAYRPRSLTGRMGSRLRPELNYFVLQVVGDSMIGAGIDDGDYVIVKREGAVGVDFRDGDIVAALIDDVDEEYTLKRLCRNNPQSFTLEPENDEYPEYTFTDGDPEVHILGVAVTLLERVDEQDQAEDTTEE